MHQCIRIVLDTIVKDVNKILALALLREPPSEASKGFPQIKLEIPEKKNARPRVL